MKIEAMKNAKIESKKGVQVQILSIEDNVKFTVSTKEGEVTYSGTGYIVDINIISEKTVKYWVLDERCKKTYEVVIGSSMGWYSGDSIELLNSPEKKLKYFAVYDSRSNSVLKDSIFVYRQDTVDHLTGLVGSPAPDYLKIREITIVVPGE